MIKQDVAEALLSINAVSLSPNEPFTWASGIKSPIYCDNRLIVSYPVVRKFISKNLIKLIEEKFPEAEVVAGRILFAVSSQVAHTNHHIIGGHCRFP